MSTCAVVILNYNGEKLIPAFLPSVLRYAAQANIYVIDNASSDNSLEILRGDYPQVRIIQLDKNYGFCGGYNRGLREIQSDYFVLLNSDVEVTEGWLEPMLRILDQNPDVGAVQPKVRSHRQRNEFEYAGAGGGFIDSLGYPFCRGRIFNHVDDDHGQYNDTREIFWSTGACMMVRSKLYHEFGGLDEDFFAHMEEIDLCWKLNRAGHRIYYTGESTVYHLGAGTLGYGSPSKTFLNFRNGLSLIYKHFNSKELVWKLPLRMILDWVAAFVYLLKGQGRSGFAVLKAHGAFFRNLGRDRIKRAQIQEKYPDYNKKAMYPSLVIIDYYLKGRKAINV